MNEDSPRQKDDNNNKDSKIEIDLDSIPKVQIIDGKRQVQRKALAGMMNLIIPSQFILTEKGDRVFEGDLVYMHRHDDPYLILSIQERKGKLNPEEPKVEVLFFTGTDEWSFSFDTRQVMGFGEKQDEINKFEEKLESYSLNHLHPFITYNYLPYFTKLFKSGIDYRQFGKLYNEDLVAWLCRDLPTFKTEPIFLPEFPHKFTNEVLMARKKPDQMLRFEKLTDPTIYFDLYFSPRNRDPENDRNYSIMDNIGCNKNGAIDLSLLEKDTIFFMEIQAEMTKDFKVIPVSITNANAITIIKLLVESLDEMESFINPKLLKTNYYQLLDEKEHGLADSAYSVNELVYRYIEDIIRADDKFMENLGALIDKKLPPNPADPALFDLKTHIKYQAFLTFIDHLKEKIMPLAKDLFEQEAKASKKQVKQEAEIRAVVLALVEREGGNAELGMIRTEIETHFPDLPQMSAMETREFLAKMENEKLILAREGDETTWSIHPKSPVKSMKKISKKSAKKIAKVAGKKKLKTPTKSKSTKINTQNLDEIALHAYLHGFFLTHFGEDAYSINESYSTKEDGFAFDVNIYNIRLPELFDLAYTHFSRLRLSIYYNLDQDAEYYRKNIASGIIQYEVAFVFGLPFQHPELTKEEKDFWDQYLKEIVGDAKIAWKEPKETTEMPDWTIPQWEKLTPILESYEIGGNQTSLFKIPPEKDSEKRDWKLWFIRRKENEYIRRGYLLYVEYQWKLQKSILRFIIFPNHNHDIEEVYRDFGEFITKTNFEEKVLSKGTQFLKNQYLKKKINLHKLPIDEVKNLFQKFLSHHFQKDEFVIEDAYSRSEVFEEGENSVVDFKIIDVTLRRFMDLFYDEFEGASIEYPYGGYDRDSFDHFRYRYLAFDKEEYDLYLAPTENKDIYLGFTKRDQEQWEIIQQVWDDNGFLKLRDFKVPFPEEDLVTLENVILYVESEGVSKPFYTFKSLRVPAEGHSSDIPLFILTIMRRKTYDKNDMDEQEWKKYKAQVRSLPDLEGSHLCYSILEKSYESPEPRLIRYSLRLGLNGFGDDYHDWEKYNVGDESVDLMNKIIGKHFFNNLWIKSLREKITDKALASHLLLADLLENKNREQPNFTDFIKDATLAENFRIVADLISLNDALERDIKGQETLTPQFPRKMTEFLEDRDWIKNKLKIEPMSPKLEFKDFQVQFNLILDALNLGNYDQFKKSIENLSNFIEYPLGRINSINPPARSSILEFNSLLNKITLLVLFPTAEKVIEELKTWALINGKLFSELWEQMSDSGEAELKVDYNLSDEHIWNTFIVKFNNVESRFYLKTEDLPKDLYFLINLMKGLQFLFERPFTRFAIPLFRKKIIPISDFNIDQVLLQSAIPVSQKDYLSLKLLIAFDLDLLANELDYWKFSEESNENIVDGIRNLESQFYHYPDFLLDFQKRDQYLGAVYSMSEGYTPFCADDVSDTSDFVRMNPTEILSFVKTLINDYKTEKKAWKSITKKLLNEIYKSLISKEEGSENCFLRSREADPTIIKTLESEILPLIDLTTKKIKIPPEKAISSILDSNGNTIEAGDWIGINYDNQELNRKIVKITENPDYKGMYVLYLLDYIEENAEILLELNAYFPDLHKIDLYNEILPFKKIKNLDEIYTEKEYDWVNSFEVLLEEEYHVTRYPLNKESLELVIDLLQSDGFRAKKALDSGEDSRKTYDEKVKASK